MIGIFRTLQITTLQCDDRFKVTVEDGKYEFSFNLVPKQGVNGRFIFAVTDLTTVDALGEEITMYDRLVSRIAALTMLRVLTIASCGEESPDNIDAYLDMDHTDTNVSVTWNVDSPGVITVREDDGGQFVRYSSAEEMMDEIKERHRELFMKMDIQLVSQVVETF